MRYILKDTGYIEAISFTHEVECNNKTCIEYTGSVPEGYENLAEWSENANINAYKIVEGNLTYDSEEDTRLQALWEEQQESSGGISGYDSLPVGSVIDFDGDEVPVGYEEVVGIVVLYDGPTNTDSTITLSDSAENYEYIEIFYRNNDFMRSSLKVHQPNSKKVSLDSHYANGTSIYLKFARATISEKTITINAQTEIFINGGSLSSLNANNIYITRVLGYKEV